MSHYDFATMLEYSRGVRESTDIETIQRMIAGCTGVQKTDEATDRAGVDYIATLRRGTEILIDAKTRTAGCSRWWTKGPELALELWSVRPEQGISGKTGWTANEASPVDYILFTFDESDSDQVFLYPFQLLRIAFRRNYHIWKKQGYKTDIQDSGRWTSECIFVPEIVVWTSVRKSMQGESTWGETLSSCFSS
jgi:hypothetical protein